jgi:hypothetical protein
MRKRPIARNAWEPESAEATEATYTESAVSSRIDDNFATVERSGALGCEKL